MTVSSAFQKATLERLAALHEEDFRAFAAAVTLGYAPEAFFQAVQSVSEGQDPLLPAGGGQPNPLTINAWSFVNDRQQYSGTYNLSYSDAARLREGLLTKRDEALTEIAEIVTQHLQRKGSTKPVTVSADGMPGARVGPGAGTSDNIGAALKAEINSNGATYGRYKFEAKETPFQGPHRFSVRLGRGFHAFFANKRGAVDVARVARVRGRNFPLIAGYIGFAYPAEDPPKFGGKIPEKANWDCVLGPDESVPPDPAPKAATTAGPSGPEPKK